MFFKAARAAACNFSLVEVSKWHNSDDDNDDDGGKRVERSGQRSNQIKS